MTAATTNDFDMPGSGWESPTSAKNKRLERRNAIFNKQERTASPSMPLSVTLEDMVLVLDDDSCSTLGADEIIPENLSADHGGWQGHNLPTSSTPPHCGRKNQQEEAVTTVVSDEETSLDALIAKDAQEAELISFVMDQSRQELDSQQCADQPTESSTWERNVAPDSSPQLASPSSMHSVGSGSKSRRSRSTQHADANTGMQYVWKKGPNNKYVKTPVATASTPTTERMEQKLLEQALSASMLETERISEEEQWLIELAMEQSLQDSSVHSRTTSHSWTTSHSSPTRRTCNSQRSANSGYFGGTNALSSSTWHSPSSKISPRRTTSYSSPTRKTGSNQRSANSGYFGGTNALSSSSWHSPTSRMSPRKIAGGPSTSSSVPCNNSLDCHSFQSEVSSPRKGGCRTPRTSNSSGHSKRISTKFPHPTPDMSIQKAPPSCPPLNTKP